MKSQLEQSITESLRLFEKLTGEEISHLVWSPEDKRVTVVVGGKKESPGQLTRAAQARD